MLDLPRKKFILTAEMHNTGSNYFRRIANRSSKLFEGKKNTHILSYFAELPVNQFCTSNRVPFTLQRNL